MKKTTLALLIATGLSAASMPALARDTHDNNNRPAYGWAPWGVKLETEINHLNRMVGHVRWQMGRYHPNSQLRREFTDVRRDVDRVNWKFKRGGYDKRDLRREVEQLHNRLHSLEVRLKVRSNDYYHWR